MTIDLRWLSAPDDEVAAAMAAVRHDPRRTPASWRRRVLLHVNYCLILWYLAIILIFLGLRVDIRASAVTMTILAGWLYGTYRLHRWVARPSPGTRLAEWRQVLTALANGFESQPGRVRAFPSLNTPRRRVPAETRFVAPGVEFGNLVRDYGRPSTWHYITVKLPAPLPHLMLDATSNNNRGGSDLPAGFERAQRLSLEGNFDRWFHLYTPAEYEPDTLYMLTPDVMAALIDTASNYNIEIVDDTLVFLTSSAADFTAPEPWQSVRAILDGPAARIVARAGRYRDERVPGQELPRVISGINVALKHPDVLQAAPVRSVGSGGRRLDANARNGKWAYLRAHGWYFLIFLFYTVPGSLAFAGLMTIFEGW